MKLFVLLVAVVCLPGALSLCPNACSNMGSCGNWDKCNCYDNWMECDCSQRVCPFTKAWADTAEGTRQPHYYAECGGKGVCDRKSGLCECFEGFEGKGCQRMSCPNMCSEHGTCEKLSEVNAGYAGWDADKIQICVCDPGWTGPSCSQRMCKPGDDPMATYDSTGLNLQTSEVQTVTITDQGAGARPTGTFLLEYKDWRGQVWHTWAIELSTLSSIAVQEALEGLPNHAIPSVEVSTVTLTAESYSFDVTFSSPDTTGNQVSLTIQHAGCSIDGCQPFYDGITAAATGVYTVTSVDGTTENAVCSERGFCNAETGICECIDGYYGESCDKQTVIM